jgi:hypothetical protein
VSPRWRDEVAIYLAPHRLALARRAGLRRRVVAEADVAVPAGAAGDFGPALARLSEVLADPAWRRASARTVVADHPWARYAVVPWVATRLDAAGRLAHARYVLGDTYGEGVADWAVTLADTPPGRPYVACAMPATLRGALEDALAPARIKLVSLQPQLVVAFNAWRRRLPANDAWFVSVGDGFLSAVYLRRGAWERVHTARLPPDWGDELERLQALARVTWGAGAPTRMFVDAPAWMGRAAATGAGIVWLEQDAGVASRAHALALMRRSRA